MKRKSVKEMLETGEVEGTMKELYQQLLVLKSRILELEKK